MQCKRAEQRGCGSEGRGGLCGACSNRGPQARLVYTVPRARAPSRKRTSTRAHALTSACSLARLGEAPHGRQDRGGTAVVLLAQEHHLRCTQWQVCAAEGVALRGLRQCRARPQQGLSSCRMGGPHPVGAAPQLSAPSCPAPAPPPAAHPLAARRPGRPSQRGARGRHTGAREQVGQGGVGARGHARCSGTVPRQSEGGGRW